MNFIIFIDFQLLSLPHHCDGDILTNRKEGRGREREREREIVRERINGSIKPQNINLP